MVVSTQKKKLSSRRLFRQRDDFDQDGIFGGAANRGQQNIRGNDGTVDRDFSANFSGSN